MTGYKCKLFSRGQKCKLFSRTIPFLNFFKNQKKILTVSFTNNLTSFSLGGDKLKKIKGLGLFSAKKFAHTAKKFALMAKKFALHAPVRLKSLHFMPLRLIYLHSLRKPL